MEQDSASSLWSACLKELQVLLAHEDFAAWFAPTRGAAFKGKTIVVSVPSEEFCKHIDKNYPRELRLALGRVIGSGARLSYCFPKQQEKRQAKEKIIQVSFNSQLSESFVFEHFVTGESNQVAFHAAKTIAKNPGRTAFTPVLIYGGVGIGKTHLAQAIGNEVVKNFPDKKVLYVPSEKFVQQYVDAHRSNRTHDFINFYQAVDVLIIDDVQFFSCKPGSQDAFFYIFNHLYQNARQLVLTADKAPIDMREIEERLLSRFKSGLQVELKLPDYSHRLAILKAKLKRDGIQIAESIITFIAESLPTNVRELEGVVNTLMAQATFSRRDIDFELAREVVSQFVRTPCRELSLEQIKVLVCEAMNVDIRQLESKTRKREITQARQIAMYFAKQLTTKYSLQQIGAEIAGRDHSTVLHSCKAVSNLMDTDRQFRMVMDGVKASLIAAQML